MNKHEIKKIRQYLTKQRQLVLKDVNRHGVKTGVLAGVIADETERADIIADNLVEHQLGYTESKLLQKIDNALLRLDAGSYGICENCHKPINAQRLKAKPCASRCIECQTAKELLN